MKSSSIIHNKFELINVNHHNNGVSLFRCWNLYEQYFLKVSISDQGNFAVINERNGYQWYYNKIGTENKTTFIENYLYEIKIPLFSGKSFSNNCGISSNEGIIENIIDFYKKICTPFGDELYIHGDLVLSNVINNNGTLFVVDWEHSHQSEIKYWGYDLIHLLFVAYYYSSTKFRQNEFLKNCYQKICENVGSSNQILERPFYNSHRYMIEKHSKFSQNLPIKDKFILANMTTKELDRLDLIVT